MQIQLSPPGKLPLFFDHQKTAFQKLCSAGNVCFSPQRAHLPIQPRTNSLIIGPSGSGKSHLARAVAGSFGVECKAITIAEWMLLGSSSKGAKRTWNSIFDFLLKNHTKKGAVIFLDEIDKLTGTTDWVQHLRVEVFRLLDLSLPPDLVNEDDSRFAQTTFIEVENFLKRRTLIIGAGAFQDLWDAANHRIGGFAGASEPDSPSQELLSRHLAKELVNRFRADVVVLEPMTCADYESMLLASAERMPAQFHARFLALGEKRIPEAYKNKQGVRFLEELVADLLSEESEQIVPPPIDPDWSWSVETGKSQSKCKSYDCSQ